MRLLLSAARLAEPELHCLGLRPNQHDAALTGVLDRLQWEQWRLPRAVARAHAQQRLDLLYSPALGAPLRCCVPVVAHVHDLIPLREPMQFSGAAGWYWKRLLPASWRRCAALTVSNASLVDEVAGQLPYPRERIHVVPYYPDPQVAQLAQRMAGGELPPAADGLLPAEPYFMTLASHEPRKNIALAIQALGRLQASGISARLVCAGGCTEHTRRLQELALSCHVGGQVSFPGYLAPAEHVRLLLKATALLFVSRYEGYGMPPQEAQSIGCPVVLSDIPCHRAVYADASRLAQLPEALRQLPPLVGVDDAEALAQEMRRLLEDQLWRQQLAQAGLAYSATFSAEATARALLAAFRSVPPA